MNSNHYRIHYSYQRTVDSFRAFVIKRMIQVEESLFTIYAWIVQNFGIYCVSNVAGNLKQWQYLLKKIRLLDIIKRVYSSVYAWYIDVVNDVCGQRRFYFCFRGWRGFRYKPWEGGIIHSKVMRFPCNADISRRAYDAYEAYHVTSVFRHLFGSPS